LLGVYIIGCVFPEDHLVDDRPTICASVFLGLVSGFADIPCTNGAGNKSIWA
jgi:hypothetical protein